MKIYQGTSAQRAASSKTGQSGDLVIETDTGRIGIADGVTLFSALPMIEPAALENQPTGYLTLDSQGKIPATVGPSKLSSFLAAVGNVETTQALRVAAAIDDGSAALVKLTADYFDLSVFLPQYFMPGFPFKQVRVLHSSNVNIAAPGSAVFDGVTCSPGDRIGLYGQTASAENGVWIYGGTSTPMTRATDANTAAKCAGMILVPQEGASGTFMRRTTFKSTDTLGTTAMTFARFNDTSTVIAIGQGGTGSTTTPSAGANVYAASGTSFGYSGVGTVGDALISGGTGAPTWANLGIRRVRACSTSNVTISNPGTAVFDGVTLNVGDEVLLRSQTVGTENGPYRFNGSAAAMTRTTWADTPAKIAWTRILVAEGTNAVGVYDTSNFTASMVIGTNSINYAPMPNYNRGLNVNLGGTGNTASPSPGAVVFGASASAYGYTAAGTTGAMLKSGGAGTPTWGSVQDVTTVTTSTTVTAATPTTILVDATSGAVTITLPNSAGLGGLPWTVKKVDSSANAVTVVVATAGTIDGASQSVLTGQWDAISVVATGTAGVYNVTGFAGARCKVTVMTSSGTFTKDARSTIIEVEGIGGGNGGGSGAVVASGTACSGGAAGAGGAGFLRRMPASVVAASVPCTVGAGGAGGAAVSTASTAGNDGGKGGTTQFGTNSTDYLAYATANAVSNRGGQIGANSAGTTNIGQFLSAGSAQGNLAAIGGSAANASGLSAPGGGAGGGISATPAAFNGGSGVASWGFNGSTPGGGTAPGGAGGAGGDAPTLSLGTVVYGSSGGGGASSTTGNGGNGGNGGRYGAGGGGGGSCLNGFTSGAGGNGAQGVLVIREWF